MKLIPSRCTRIFVHPANLSLVASTSDRKPLGTPLRHGLGCVGAAGFALQCKLRGLCCARFVNLFSKAGLRQLRRAEPASGN